MEEVEPAAVCGCARAAAEHHRQLRHERRDEDLYERRLIDQALPALVHDQFGDSYPIPANNGKTIEFRKYDALPKATTP